MNVAMWVLLGAAIGLGNYLAMRANSERGPVISIIIGTVGGYLGGSVFAPMFDPSTADPTVFSPFSSIVAAASALGSVTLANIIFDRIGM